MSLTTILLLIVVLQMGVLIWALWDYTPIEEYPEELEVKRTAKAKKTNKKTKSNARKRQ